MSGNQALRPDLRIFLASKQAANMRDLVRHKDKALFFYLMNVF